MKELVLTALLAAGVSSGGTYTVMRSQPVPPPQIVVEPHPDTELVRQVQQQTVILQRLLDHAQAQAISENRMLLVGRLVVRSLTGTDPLPILQQAKVADLLPPDPRMPR